ncbi:class I SAM-dependent methyltransferase [Streptomyces sp. WM6378]|uniref:class I SAM-dependent methyltransferase n=1 Tax=Streptomyces sp. WM6378 TaxID=1415557 RepID=UPI00099BBEB9|nr:class I SAM-dependent methyltransferase [Streptomyces sp. WM6378]
MPTLPPEQPLPAGNEPHRARRMAESFGSDAERYDRARPRYPDALVRRIVAAAPGPAVLDVGCGTGIAARQLQAMGCHVLGVEPDARMADVARRFGVEVDVATVEAWEPAGRTFDAVTAGQAWHWIDPVAGAAKAARALRPGGLLAAFWNAFQLPPEVAEALATGYRRVAPHSAFDLQGMARPTFDAYAAVLAKSADGIRKARGFDEPEQWRFPWERTYTRDAWLDQLPTLGILTGLAADQLAEVLREAGAAVDALGGGFTMRYATMAVTATRTGAA